MKLSMVRYNHRCYKPLESINEKLTFLGFYSMQSLQFIRIYDYSLSYRRIRR